MILPSEREHLIWERLYCPSEPVLPLTQRGVLEGSALGLGLQLAFGILVIRSDPQFNALQWLGDQVQVTWFLQITMSTTCHRYPGCGRKHL
ncbi:uncharacterized protein LOC105260616 [Felis catus]|uniref:uncharacterized protein LOC105260616 n=1 Tax=Felis catus TaxID=9685 RepID=UPI001D19D6E6|nr:uncharacterized protein LOC105260616 [Felis catus]